MAKVKVINKKYINIGRKIISLFKVKTSFWFQKKPFSKSKLITTLKSGNPIINYLFFLKRINNF